MFKLPVQLMLCAAATYAVYRVMDLVSGLGHMRLPFALVVTGLFWIRVLGPYVVEIIPAIRRRAMQDAWEPWQGRYYAFDNRQIRLFLIEDVIWVPARDVAALLTPQPQARELRILGADYGQIPGQKLYGYTEAGLLRVVATRTRTRVAAHELIRFGNWLQKEAFPNLRRLPASATP
jgi:hypothetical protein